MQWASLLRLRFVLCEASAVRRNSHASDSIHNYCIYCERAWVNLFICAHSLPFPAPPDAAYLTAFEAKFVNRRLTKMISTQNRLQLAHANPAGFSVGILRSRSQWNKRTVAEYRQKMKSMAHSLFYWRPLDWRSSNWVWAADAHKTSFTFYEIHTKRTKTACV